MHLQYELYCPYCEEEFETIQDFENHLLTFGDNYHKNLYYLIIKRNMKLIDKHIFLTDNK